MKKKGLIILLVGALVMALALFDFTFFTRENVIDVVDLQINTRKKHTISWAPFVGVAIMAAGGGAYLLGSRRSY